MSIMLHVYMYVHLIILGMQPSRTVREARRKVSVCNASRRLSHAKAGSGGRYIVALYTLQETSTVQQAVCSRAGICAQEFRL